jgi:hypothetical protein
MKLIQKTLDRIIRNIIIYRHWKLSDSLDLLIWQKWRYFMKKLVVKGLFLVLMLCNESLFAQDSLVDVISQCISAVTNNKIPEDFTRMDRTTYVKETVYGTANLAIENGIVIMCGLGSVYDRTDQASRAISPFYDYFEANGQYYDTIDFGDVYRIGGIYVIITKPTRRQDGKIAAGLIFMKSLY